jgi:hypothetical protein
MDTFDLKKYLAENKLTESPGYVDTFNPQQYDFYLATPEEIESAASEMVYTLMDKGVMLKTQQPEKLHRAATEIIRKELGKILEDLIKPNLYQGELYKAAIKKLPNNV